VARVLAPFDEIAGDAGVISVQDMRDRRSQQAAQRRASAIGAILRYDLNGDLRITAAEIVNAQTTDAQRASVSRGKKKKAIEAPRSARLARIEAERVMQRYDSNRDGAIDMTEVSQACDLDGASNRTSQISALLATDLGKDGKLTRKEVKAFARRTFNAIDMNKDGRISSEEYAATKPDETLSEDRQAASIEPLGKRNKPTS
jgi:Ca2+-binding EF-hand superfamily protein